MTYHPALGVSIVLAEHKAGSCGVCHGHFPCLDEVCPQRKTKEPEVMLRNTLAQEGRAVEEPGGLKYDQDKPRMDLLDPVAIDQLARVLTFGANKYAPHNWRKGITKSRLLAAALRHLFAYLGGQDKDPETGLSHVAHAMCCCMFLLGLEGRANLDDRFKESTNARD